MHAIYAFGVLILIAFLGSRPFFKRRQILSSFNFFYYSGILYIFVGQFLGENGLNVLSSEVLKNFSPLISLGLGWVGFLFGFQLERKNLRKFPKKYIGLSLLQFVFIFATVFFLMAKILTAILPGESTYLIYGIAVAFGLLSSVSSPTLLNACALLLPSRGKYHYLARFLVSVGAFWSIAGLALLHSFWHYPFFQKGFLIKGLVFLAASTLLPILLAYLFHALTLKKTNDQDLLVYLLGFVFFVSGTAFYFNLLPLFLCMIMGISYSNLSRIHERIYPMFLAAEKPLYVVLLILIGALWDLNLSWKLGGIVLMLILFRVLGHWLFTPIFSHLLRFPFALPNRFGLAFMSAGGMGVALSVSLKLSYPIPLVDMFLSASLLTIVLGEIISPGLLKSSLFELESRS